jgi:heme-degrading monooxygenase HmoA
MDEKVNLSTQMDSGAGPVILINKFNVEPDDVDQFIKTWAAASAIISSDVGFCVAHNCRPKTIV